MAKLKESGSFPNSKRYLEDFKSRVPVRICSEGYDAVVSHALKERSIFSEPRESLSSEGIQTISMLGDSVNTKFERRIRRSYFANIWLQVLRSNVDRLSRKAILLNNYPDIIERFSRDVNGEGADINQFAVSAILSAEQDGVSFILVDSPSNIDNSGNVVLRPVTESESRDNFPYWSELRSDDFDPLSVTTVNRKRVLRNAAIFLSESSREVNYDKPSLSRESHTSMWREFLLTDDGVKYYDHVLKGNNRNDTIDTKKSGPWIPINRVGGPLRVIPIVPVYSDMRTLGWRGIPQYADSARAMICAWNKRSHLDAAIPEMVRIIKAILGYSGDPDNLRSMIKTDIVYTDRDQGSATLLETTGTAFEVAQRNIDADENFIRTYNRAIASSGNLGIRSATEIGFWAWEASGRPEALTLCAIGSLSTAIGLTASMMGIPLTGNETIEWESDTHSEIDEKCLNRIWEYGISKGIIPPKIGMVLEQKAGGFSEKIDIEKLFSDYGDSVSVEDDIDE